MPRIFLSPPPQCWDCNCTPAEYGCWDVGAGDLNSGPRVCAASPIPAEPSLQAPGVQICGESVVGVVFLPCPGSVIPVKSQQHERTNVCHHQIRPHPCSCDQNSISDSGCRRTEPSVCSSSPGCWDGFSKTARSWLSAFQILPSLPPVGFWRRELLNTTVSMILDYVLEVELDPEVEREFPGSVSTPGC